MKKGVKQAGSYVVLGPFTTVVYSLMLIFCALAYLSGIEFDNKVAIIAGSGIAAILGLFYNLVVFRFVKKAEFTAKYLQVFFLIIALGITAFFTGGLNSPWYLAILFVVIICSVLGFGAIYINLALMVVFIVLDIVFNLLSNPNSSFQFRVFPLTLAALVCAWLVAYSTESLKKARSSIAQYGTQLESSKLSEKALLASIADPLMFVDSALKINFLNQPAQSLSGWDINDATGLSYTQVFDLRDSDDRPVSQLTDPFLYCLQNKSVLKTEKYYMIRKKDNLKIPLDISIAPTFDNEGRPMAAVAILRDVSKKQALERERSEFVSTASHEMRTPVAAIEGFISMATNPNIATIDERARGFLNKAHESSIHLGKLFQDLLSVSKIEDKQLHNEKVLFNLSDLVLKVATEFQPIATEEHLKLVTHIGGSTKGKEKIVVPAFPVYADAERIREVLSNLIDNAIKYTANGTIEIELTSSDGWVNVAVKDSGIGIAAQEQKHIFEKFYRVNNELTREHSGTGLGLYISRNIIENAGGVIGVSSEPGKGSTFTFKLPIVKKVAN